eukprot:TRINITY_DN2629_c0_g1_i7.p1 TRINITY_DN2629_c0_g1~~TRINITY_DN2629_c0_g1_i7.p1  ORF type:complete len:232 (-),score=29.01 TRINITY_DN2629_c0_g1_i7:23-718(-)
MCIRDRSNVVDEIKIEIIGILANTKLEDEWLEYLKNNTFVDFLETHLSSEYVDDDIILEVLQLIANLCETPKCTNFLSQTKILKLLSVILEEKCEDDEFILQILFIIYRFLFSNVATNFIIRQSGLIDKCLELTDDPKKLIRKMNDEILDLVMDYDPDLSEQIKEKRFYAHNREWIESIDQLDENYEQYIQQRPDGQAEIGWNAYEEALDSRMWDSESDLEGGITQQFNYQ